MIKKTVTYIGFDEQEHVEDLYFHLSKSELVELELGSDGGFSTKLKNLVAESNPSKLVAMYKELMGMSYGVRSEDGRRFIKSDELTNEFYQSMAYDILFSELTTDPQKALDLIQGMVPKDMMEAPEVQEALKKIVLPEPAPLTQVDLENMSADELRRRLANQTKM